MQAVVFRHEEEFGRIEVASRFDFEDRFLPILVPPRPCRDYREPHPSPRGVRVFDFEAKPYLEFAKQVQNETHFHVMQEGRPTGFTVILR